MNTITNIVKKERIQAYVELVAGCIIGAMAYPLFFLSNHIAPGGATGVATILNHIFGLPVGITSMLLNVPLFIIGYRSMGKTFAFRSLVATILFSLCIDLIPLKSFTDNVLLSSIFGGILLGVGIGLILRAGATTGGSDMLARIVNRKLPWVSMGALLIAIDCVVIVSAGFSMKAEAALYAIITIYVAAKVIDQVLLGFGNAKACYIISNEYKSITKEVMKQLERGTTLFMAKGGYSKEDKTVVLTIVSPRDVMRVKQITHAIDEKAFVFITDTHEILGEGFKELIEEE